MKTPDKWPIISESVFLIYFFFLSDFMLIMESNIYHKTHAAP